MTAGTTNHEDEAPVRLIGDRRITGDLSELGWEVSTDVREPRDPRDDAEVVDEVVAHGADVHLERMSSRGLWASITVGGWRLDLNLFAREDGRENGRPKLALDARPERTGGPKEHAPPASPSAEVRMRRATLEKLAAERASVRAAPQTPCGVDPYGEGVDRAFDRIEAVVREAILKEEIRGGQTGDDGRVAAGRQGGG